MCLLKKSIMKRNRPGCFGSDSHTAVSNDVNAENDQGSDGKQKAISFPEKSHEFAKVVCEVPSIASIDQDIRQQLWYSRSDFQLTKSTARVIAQESERYGLSKHLDHAYTSCTTEEDVDDRGDSDHQDRRDNREHHSQQQQRHVRSTWQDKLNLWALHGHSRRGLERLANSTHGDFRKDDQYRYQQVILRTQQELKRQSPSRAAADMASATSDLFSEKLRRISTKMSYKARQFAQMMGEADAHAARHGCTSSTTAASKCHSADVKSLGLPYIDGHYSEQQQLSQQRFNRLSDLPRKSNPMSTSASRHTHKTTTAMGAATPASIQPQFTIRTNKSTQNSDAAAAAATKKSERTTSPPPPSLSWRTTARMA